MKRPIEKVMLSLISICVLALVSANVLRKFEVINVLSDNASAGGVYYKDSDIFNEPRYITIGLIGCAPTVLLLNGEPICSMTMDGDYAVVKVYDGDVLSADLRDIENEITVNVVETSEGMSYPLCGTKRFVSGGIETLFRVECE